MKGAQGGEAGGGARGFSLCCSVDFAPQPRVPQWARQPRAAAADLWVTQCKGHAINTRQALVTSTLILGLAGVWGPETRSVRWDHGDVRTGQGQGSGKRGVSGGLTREPRSLGSCESSAGRPAQLAARAPFIPLVPWAGRGNGLPRGGPKEGDSL